ncbi:hypothetical protein CesoFtcFv8_013024 [Champsocephalus esox]|uniref:Uncharacterized protein n=2 Tax=Champsocephalus TaxID=52236 RepID=A0AAN8DI52_CHAGU|nr:hypothetical protein CesoFtcFv8_013024 [Champsocephalus esox]KAK5922619.1 hypothetical protein CgunFtcFv8_019865 [Champsocephalus gunnari]
MSAVSFPPIVHVTRWPSSAIVASASGLTLLTLCDETTKVAITQVAARVHSLIRSSLLTALSNLEPSMTKVSPSSTTLLAGHSC